MRRGCRSVSFPPPLGGSVRVGGVFEAEDHSRIILISGGARSGKSDYALRIGEEISGRRIFVATAELLRDPSGSILDFEMAERIRRHRKSRSQGWETVEEPVELAACLDARGAEAQVMVVDCLTLWLSNLLERDMEAGARVSHLCEVLRKASVRVILVTNEVGMGIIPDNPLGRRFVDLAGAMNREVARAADRVYLMVSGMPVKVK
ncbi:MAG: bifunctional adenosylcobinamide kinase/adenosylcobinamide-phosphate guanylyltransferase [Nitrospirae bacterium]|nr:bifunctional adenosylcobinamide kinase/adenosylcobinamide-phosphate guanylyltransferase [Nitrospirota bacterium]